MVQLDSMRSWMILVLVALVVGCESAPPLPPADHTYETRGMVERLQARNDPRLMILHEEIPDFVGIDGNVAAMHSMSMEFGVAPDVSTAGLAVGTKIAFTFEVRWEGGEPLLITKLETLPADTKLDLTK